MEILSSTSNKKIQGGFTLVEAVIVLALMGGIGLVSAKIIEIVEKGAKKTQRQENQFNYQVTGLRILQDNLKGLKKHQFDLNLLYQNDSSSKNFTLNASTLKPGELLEYSGDPLLLTSFLFKKKIGENVMNYLTVCLPVDQALNDKLNYGDLLKNDLWPFIRSAESGYSAYCCKRTEPMCNTNPVFSKSATHIVQMFRQDSKTNTLIPVLKRGEFSAVSGMGYFIFTNKTNEKALHARFFTFFNECVSQRIIFGKSSEKCDDHLSIKATEIVEEFDYETEGVNNLGGSIGL